MEKTILAAISCILVFLSLQFDAMAQKGQSAEEIAKSAFAEGNRLFDAEKFGEAADAYRRAYNAKPNWRILYNIGHAEAAAREYGRSIEAFQLYLAESGDAIAQDRNDEVVEQIKNLRNRVASVRVTAPSGAIVMIDGMERGRAPALLSMNINAGRNHVVKVVLGDRILLEQPVRIWAGEEIHLVAEDTGGSVTPTPVPPAVVSEDTGPPLTTPVEEPESDESTGTVEPSAIPATGDSSQTVTPVSDIPLVRTIEQKHPLRVTGIVLSVVGIVGLAGSGATGTFMIIKKKQLEENCDGRICTTADEEKDLKIARNMALATSIALPAGGGLLATGVVFMIVGRRLERKHTRTGSVLPVFSPDFTGLLWERSF